MRISKLLAGFLKAAGQGSAARLEGRRGMAADMYV
jgi:hypothetical protein